VVLLRLEPALPEAALHPPAWPRSIG
jgi:hypothetical protein